MAQSYDSTFGRLIRPGAYSAYTVATNPTGAPVSGIVTLIGEADGGPDYTLETDLEETALFGPDQLSEVKAKYLSGNLVDAYAGLVTASGDDEITGAPTAIIFVKTNPSTKASSSILDPASAAYGTIYDRSYGALGNLLYYTIAETNAEVKPTTSSFTYIPNVGTVDVSFRSNGGTATTVNLSANTTPTAFVSAVDAIAGVAATGGANRGIIGSVTGNLTVTASGNTITLTRSVNWSVTPTIGDTLVIPTASAVAGAGSANVGAYVITNATATVINATKLSDAGKGGAVVGVITAPVAVGSTPIAATTDASAYSPATITLEGSTIVNGIGKTLEINALSTGADLFTRQAFVLGTTTAATWVSASGSPKLLVSGTERSVTLNINRQVDSVSESIPAGGDIALKVGYTGTTASVVVTGTTMTFTVTGGSGANLTVNLKAFSTLSDLATYISAQTGYTASVGTTALGQQSPLSLDEGTFNCATTFGNPTLRLKMDAVDFFESVNSGSVVVSFDSGSSSGLPAAAGLPATVSANTFLSGGAKGSTTDTIYQAGLTAMEYITTDMVVPLFSRDASLDILDSNTESGSTYTIDAILASTKSHCLAMTTFKKRRERIAFLSSRSAYATVKDQAANQASKLTSLSFADCKEVSASTGAVTQFQPWMTAVKAAGMQAAGRYKTIFNKIINSQGFVYSQSGFNPKNDSTVEMALESGLLMVYKDDDGSWRFVSDQTTYQKDNNFVNNSIQAVNGANYINRFLRNGMGKPYIGKVLSEFDAAQALSTFDSLIQQLRALKYVAASEDAPKGYKGASIKISSVAMAVKAEVKEATGLYFIDINWTISQVTSSATQ